VICRQPLYREGARSVRSASGPRKASVRRRGPGSTERGRESRLHRGRPARKMRPGESELRARVDAARAKGRRPAPDSAGSAAACRCTPASDRPGSRTGTRLSLNLNGCCPPIAVPFWLIGEKTFAQRLKRLRLARGITQKELSISAKVSKDLVFRWERGLHGGRRTTVGRVAGKLGVSPEYLLRGNGTGGLGWRNGGETRRTPRTPRIFSFPPTV